jgi:hypothetical protein
MFMDKVLIREVSDPATIAGIRSKSDVCAINSPQEAAIWLFAGIRNPYFPENTGRERFCRRSGSLFFRVKWAQAAS